MNNIALPEPKKEIEVGNNKKYRVEATINGAVYSKEANNQILGLYYLVLWKGYPKKDSTWKLSTAVKHLRKLINIFYIKYPEKSIVTSLPLDSTPSMAKILVLKKQ